MDHPDPDHTRWLSLATPSAWPEEMRGDPQVYEALVDHYLAEGGHHPALAGAYLQLLVTDWCRRRGRGVIADDWRRRVRALAGMLVGDPEGRRSLRDHRPDLRRYGPLGRELWQLTEDALCQTALLVTGQARLLRPGTQPLDPAPDWLQARLAAWTPADGLGAHPLTRLPYVYLQAAWETLPNPEAYLYQLLLQVPESHVELGDYPEILRRLEVGPPPDLSRHPVLEHLHRYRGHPSPPPLEPTVPVGHTLELTVSRDPEDGPRDPEPPIPELSEPRFLALALAADTETWDTLRRSVHLPGQIRTRVYAQLVLHRGARLAEAMYVPHWSPLLPDGPRDRRHRPLLRLCAEADSQQDRGRLREYLRHHGLREHHCLPLVDHHGPVYAIACREAWGRRALHWVDSCPPGCHLRCSRPELVRHLDRQHRGGWRLWEVPDHPDVYWYSPAAPDPMWDHTLEALEDSAVV